MSDFSAWLGNSVAIDAAPRAVLALNRILDKPTSIAFKTPTGSTLAAQTVRVEVDNRSAVITSAAGGAPAMRLIVFGVRGHPTVADTVMAEGYRFVLSNDEYRIDDIILQLGEIQGVATATG